MKASLKLILVFLTVAIFGTLIAATIVMLGLDLRILVAGGTVPPFSADFFLRGIFLSFPFVCVSALLLMVLYLIRHPAHQLLPIITYIVLGVISWGIAIPACAMGYSQYSRVHFGWVGIADSADITPYYFRTYAGNVYYYAHIVRRSAAERNVYGDGILIDFQGIHGKAGDTYLFPLSVVQRDEESQYSDVIFKDATRMPSVIEKPLTVYTTLFYTACSSVLSGVIAWIAFASLGLALLATPWLVSLSSWRLLKAGLVLILGILVLVLNYLVYAQMLLPSVAAALRQFVVGIGLNVPQVLGGMVHIREPLAVCLNLLCVLVFFVLGMIGKQRSSKHAYLVGDDI